MMLNPWNVLPIFEMFILGLRLRAGGGITSLRLMPELSRDSGNRLPAIDERCASDAMSMTSCGLLLLLHEASDGGRIALQENASHRGQ